MNLSYVNLSRTEELSILKLPYRAMTSRTHSAKISQSSLPLFQWLSNIHCVGVKSGIIVMLRLWKQKEL